MSEESDHSSNTQEVPPPKKVVNKKEGLVMAGGYILGWVVFIVVFKLIYGRYRKAQSTRDGGDAVLNGCREHQGLVRQELG